MTTFLVIFGEAICFKTWKGLNFNPCLSLPSVATGVRKQFQCLIIVLNNKTGSFFLKFNWCETIFRLLKRYPIACHSPFNKACRDTYYSTSGDHSSAWQRGVDTACTHSDTNKEQPVSGNLENLGVPVVDDSPFSILLVDSWTNSRVEF